MVYFIETVREDKYTDETPNGYGEWNILEHLNMSVVAKVYHKNMADHIIKLLNADAQEVRRKYEMERFVPQI